MNNLPATVNKHGCCLVSGRFVYALSGSFLLLHVAAHYVLGALERGAYGLLKIFLDLLFL